MAPRAKRSTRRNNKRFKNKRVNISNKQVAKIAKKVNQQTTVIKRHDFAGVNQLMPFGTSQNGLITAQTMRVFAPLQLNKDGSNSASADFHNRESQRIYARNCMFKMNVQPHRQYVQPFQIRLLCGYYKGDDNDGTQGVGLTPAALKVLYPNINDAVYTKNTGHKDYYWKYRKTFTFCPRQLYNGIQEYPTEDDQSEIDSALWLPKDISYNFRFNRIHEYEDSDSDSLNGWTPIIVVQCMPLEGGQVFTRPNIESDIASGSIGTTPSPLLRISMITYFNDCH